MSEMKRGLRILMVNRGVFRVPPETSGGGAEKHGYQLANHLALLGHSVYFITKIGSAAEYHPSVEIYGVPPIRRVIPPGAPFFSWILKHLFGNLLSAIIAFRTLSKQKFEIDAIHCHGSLAALLLTKIVGWRIPVVYTMHDAPPWIVSYPERMIRIIRKFAFLVVDVQCLKCVRHVITVSPALREEAIRWGVPPTRVSFIPTGVLAPHATRENVTKSSYGLFVGRLESRKRVDLIVRTLSRLRTQDVRFIVVGDGPEKRELIHLSNNLGVSDRISFTGYVDDETLVKYYSSASFFVFPSIAEGFPTAVLEAMAHGLPVIATRTTSYDGILSHGVNSLLLDRPNVEELEGCIEKLESSQELGQRLSSFATLAINETFSWTVVARQVVSVYGRVSSRQLRAKSVSKHDKGTTLFCGNDWANEQLKIPNHSTEPVLAP